MRWFWQRRRQRQATVAASSVEPSPGTTVQRAPTSSGRLGQPRQLTSELLVLARDYLQTIGSRVRVEDDDVLSAIAPDGALTRYTTTLAKARNDESMTLLVEGSAALATMLDDIAARSRLTALRLAPAADPIALALERCAQPVAKCGRCLEFAPSSDTEQTVSSSDRCETCPLRERRLVLRWRGSGPLTARVARQEEAHSVELAYLVVARDRQGRRDEWVRRAVDVATGQATPALDEAVFTTAQSESLPVAYEQQLSMACAAAGRALSESLAATGIFLRQRSLDEYHDRLEEVAATFDRLQRESPESTRAIKASRSRELSGLSEAYGVDTEALLESACFITSPHAMVALRPHKARGELLLRVDTGRQYVMPPACATCGTDVHAGYVCDAGHAVCTRCAAACSQCGAWRCASCGEPSQTTCARCGHSLRATDGEMTPSGKAEAVVSDGVFTVRHLKALPPEMWLTAVEWLLTRQGITLESRKMTGELVIWQGRAGTGAGAGADTVEAIIAAYHPQEQWALDEMAVREAAAHLAISQAGAMRMILATTPASEAARQAAQQLGIQLLDQRALQDLLVNLASAHARERERQHDEIQARAAAAGSARQALLEAIDTIEQALAPLRRTRRSGGTSGAGAAASRALSGARTAFERASLAWETLLTDWMESFGERPARNGGLVIHTDTTRFEEMAERASHLRTALLDAIAALAEAPARGEAGYTAWRQAVVDECAARCEAWRWRIRSYDPAAWSDFARAWNAKAAEKAAEAMTAAGHATARADKAQAQAARAG